MRRTAANGFIAMVLLFQVAMPLRYYLFERGNDERFAWRMLSSIMQQQCRVEVYETHDGAVRPVPIYQDVHGAWIDLLAQDRPAVVAKYLNRRCDLGGIGQARLVRTCIAPDRTPLPPDVRILTCADRSLKDPAR